MMLLIGAPCSGKSTVGQLLAQITAKEFITLDVFVQQSVAAATIKPGETLTDRFIDSIVIDLLNHLRANHEKDCFIYELPYHDYRTLFNQGKFLNTCNIIGFYASLETLLYRNKERKSEAQIPVRYIERCFHSVKELMDEYNDKIRFYNTEGTSPETIVERIMLRIK